MMEDRGGIGGGFVALALILLAGSLAEAQRTLISGEQCVFPFQFEGEVYSDCLEFNGGEWCQAEGGFFGQCAPRGPGDQPQQQQIPGTAQGGGFAPLPVTDALQPPPIGDQEPRRPLPPPAPPIIDYANSDSQCCQLLAGIGFSSNLPTIILDTNGQEIIDEPKIPGRVCTCGAPGGDFTVDMGIEIRGSTSARDFAKKSFALETRDPDGNDLDISFLGLPEDSDWVLYGPEMDRTMGMRNFLTMELAHATGRYASNTRYVEVFLVQDGRQFSENHYNGIYVLMEKIKRDKHRVDVQKMSEEDISGGYVFKYDNDNHDEGDKIIISTFTELEFVMVYPKKNAATQDHLDYVGQYLGEFEEAMSTGIRLNWLDYIDEDSFVDFFLVIELTKNPDGYRGSCYFHKDAGGPLVAGPNWDFNEAYGMCCGYPFEGYLDEGVSNGISGGSAISPEGWRYNICLDEDRCIEDPQDGVSPYYMVMMQDPTFFSKVASRWGYLRQGPWSNAAVEGLIYELQGQIQDAVLRNHRRWKKAVGGGSDQKNLDLWEGEVSAMLQWVKAHMNWMDSQLIGGQNLG